MNSWVPLDGTTLATMGKMVIHTSAMKVSISQTVVQMPGKACKFHSTTLIFKASLSLTKSWMMNVHRKLQEVLRFDIDLLL